MASELMTLEPRQHIPEKKADPRASIVDALMKLAALQPFEDITIRDICANAGVSLADFRDAFPSKGAVLAGLSRKVDRAVLAEAASSDMSTSRDRLFDVLMRRFDAMAPYREGLRGVYAWLRREPLAAMEINRSTLNSMRFMLESAGLDSEGPAGALKLQGLALAWARVFAVWLDDTGPDFSKTMAALDNELTRGERFVSGLDRLNQFTSPLRAMLRSAMDRGRRARSRSASDAGVTDEPI